MPRRLRNATGGLAYHVLNRAVGRLRLFDDEADYLAMERVIDRTFGIVPMRIASYCLMPNHWHMVLWPRALLMALAATFGGYVGARMAQRVGRKFIRRVIVAIGFTITIVMIWRMW